MSYVHAGQRPVVMQRDPIDRDSTDWVVFSYSDLLPGESITDHSALISGGTIKADSTYIGVMEDADGNVYQECYGVSFSPSEDADSVAVTHRTSRAVAGIVTLTRENIDRTVIIPVGSL